MAKARVEGLTLTKDMYNDRVISLPNTELELARLMRMFRWTARYTAF
jgi:hypothetical protein